MNTILRRIYTPSELNREARIQLESTFGLVWVEGEISNLSAPASGHLYFSLKDDKAQLRCALFRHRARLLNAALADGLHVEAAGRVSLYEPRGDYQLLVETVAPAGAGALREQFEKLKAKLAAEGLFDEQRKRPLPAMPLAIGLITSASGAALHDFTHILERRWPLARILLYPAAVQGSGAPAELRRALARAVAERRAEVIVIGRGGGSLEDLAAFNDEALARDLAACPLPTVSAVGHEVDFTIADFVADRRAPTPSAAAELVSPESGEIARRIGRDRTRLVRAIDWLVTRESQRLDRLRRLLRQLHPRRRLGERERQLAEGRRRLVQRFGHDLERRRVQCQTLGQRLNLSSPGRRLGPWRELVQRSAAVLRRRIAETLAARNTTLAAAAARLHGLSPLAVLARGYALVYDAEERRLLACLDDFTGERRITVRGRDYRLEAEVLTATPPADPL